MVQVLCVEDEAEMSQLMEMILSREGYDVKVALNGQQGLDLLQQYTPDVILLDLMMPDLDGWDVYQQLKDKPATSKIPVIIVTARAQASEKTIALKVAQVDDYITKPFNPTVLLDTVRSVLEKRPRTP